MRYYLSTCEYKWTHARTQMEMMWVMREVGTEVFKLVNSHNWKWHLIRSKSQTLPEDIYCRCDIYVEIDNSKHATLFLLKYPKAELIEKA